MQHVMSLVARRSTGARWAAAAFDIALVTTVAAIGIGGQIAARTNTDVESAPLSGAMAVLAVVAAIPIAWRRQQPLATLAAIAVAVMAAAAVDRRGLFSGQVALELVIACFAIGSWSERRRLGTAVLLSLLVAVVLGALDDGSSVLAALAFAFALVALPAVAGYATRARRRYVEEVERRLVAVEADRDAEARRAVEAERARIARELHDVVAHHVSLIGVQAGAARTALERSPDAARASLSAIEASSRAAVGEMRQLLDVLRPLDDPGDRAPQPGVPELHRLIARWREAGVAIDASIDLGEGELTPTLSLACYRIVEEALTNVARHSCAGAASVRVVVRPTTVDVRVVDAGPARVPATTRSGGRGLIGIRERAGLFGGDVAAGPRPGGGFEVDVSLPR